MNDLRHFFLRQPTHRCIALFLPPLHLSERTTAGVRPYLSDLAVADRCRRMGIGTELVKACEEACIGWGYDHLFLKVRVGNVAAKNLYENLGYVVHSSSSLQDPNGDSGSGFMVETGSDPKEIMLCGDLVARAQAIAAREAKAEASGGGVVRNKQ